MLIYHDVWDRLTPLRNKSTNVVVGFYVYHSGYRSNSFIIGLSNVSSNVEQPVMGHYAMCGQYPGTVSDGATVSLQCTGTNLLPARYVIVQFPITDYMNFCELDVCAYGILIYFLSR